MEIFKNLDEMRRASGPKRTVGLADEVLVRFAADDRNLIAAIERGYRDWQRLSKEDRALLQLPESELILKLQSGLRSFYSNTATEPYVGLAGQGPWIVTTHGAVIYDTGGYGMLGFGHCPRKVERALAKSFVMANVASASLTQYRFTEKFMGKIGQRRKSGCPYAKIMCLNGGSEAMALAARISDVNAKIMTDPGARHAGKAIKILSVKKSFHGRTQRAAQASDSTAKSYAVLASFRDRKDQLTVEPNSVEDLRRVFREAESKGYFIELMYLEPVQGEGNPGMATTPEFYSAARELTRAHGGMLIIDSIQACMRVQGQLSIVDYPGFEKLDPPDMESFSKAINAGQFPLSVLAVTAQTDQFYKTGIYGNTMTSNPRAMEVGCAVLDMYNPKLRKNILARGAEMVEKLRGLKSEFGSGILGVQGTGLLIGMDLDPVKFPVTVEGGVEQWMRERGVNVIHGGENALRFTPWFNLSSAEIDLIVDMTGQALRHFAGQGRSVSSGATAARPVAANSQ